MGHQISAIVCRPTADVNRLSDFDLRFIGAGDFVIIPLNAHHSDNWTERLGLEFGHGHSDVFLDCRFTHYVAAFTADGSYALIETDYFGGAGDQVAAVYSVKNDRPLFASKRVPKGAINEALRLIGVEATPGIDEFESLGLGAYRNFEEYFESYYE